MKKQLLLFLCAFLLAPVVNSQELITGGNMEDPAAWNVYWGSNGPDTGTFEFNYVADLPAAGAGGCYRVTSRKRTANMLWQPVTIIPGHEYKLTGAYKYIADTAVNTWVEFFVTRVKPTGGDISTAMGWSLNTWMAGVDLVFDGTFQDDFTLANIPSAEFQISDTVTQTEWYVVLKAGCWNENADTVYAFDLLFDEISMEDLGLPEYTEFAVEKLVDGTVDDEEDFDVNLSMKWDVDSVYLIIDVVDDSITTIASPDIYNNDNVEIYFDMTNSKLPNWPRTNGWPMPYTSGQDGLFQLRIVHDSVWAKYNAGLALDTRLVHAKTASGYQMAVNIPWDTLYKGYVPQVGDVIGFDVLASDNDSTYRNQLSFHAKTTSIWIDPASWGTLLLADNNHFVLLPDNEKPTTPDLTVVVDGAEATLEWEASTDNTVVDKYIVFDGSAVLDTVWALETGNAFDVEGEMNANLAYGVTAIDVNGNNSAKAAVSWSKYPVKKLVDGTIDDAQDFNVDVSVKWDADSVYLIFDVVDDSITTVASPDIYNNDNVELYFDMTNGKLANWPRTNGWPMPYASGTDGYYQFRMVHDSAWAKYNEGLALSTRLVHTRTADGYKMNVHIPWDTLDAAFEPKANELIGFDVLASDNDDNYRNQLSLHANSTSIWIDPASWATMKLTANKVFAPVYDVDAPTAPANLAAAVDGNDVTLTWDASTDDRVVDKYIISDGEANIDTIFALQTGNTYTITGATNGAHTYGVTAMDVNLNISDKSTVEASVGTGLDDHMDSYVSVYPNPSQGIFKISAENTAPVVFEVYEITGALIADGIFTENYTLDLSEYNKGVYFLNLKSEGKTQVTKLIVQ
ncbi:MAG: T9SS type A sorting domain-containing protein [Bacteroidales bacterium]|nr:T9SS type A sorting domain-containing protein [Bacteroidales bacterium]